MTAFELATAQDGFAAIEEFDRFHPDMVFLRTMLPKKHGFQVCQEMVERSGSRRVPIVMHCSIYKSRKYRNDAIKIYGAAEYLEDPIQEDALRRFWTSTLRRLPGRARSARGPRCSGAPGSRGTGGQTQDRHQRFHRQSARGDALGHADRVPKKPKAAAPAAVEATVAFDDLMPKASRSQAPGAATIPAAAEGSEVTSEELFGDVIQDVTRRGPKAAAPAPPPPAAAPGSSKAVAPPQTRASAPKAEPPMLRPTSAVRRRWKRPRPARAQALARGPGPPST